MSLSLAVQEMDQHIWHGVHHNDHYKVTITHAESSQKGLSEPHPARCEASAVASTLVSLVGKVAIAKTMHISH